MCNANNCKLENLCDRKVDDIFDFVIRLEQRKRWVYGVFDNETQSCMDFLKRPQKPPKFELVVNTKWWASILSVSLFFIVIYFLIK